MSIIFSKINIQYYLLSLLCLFQLIQAHFAVAKTQWEALYPGLEYTQVQTSHGKRQAKIHAFKVDLTLHQLDLAFAQDLNQSATSVAQLAKYKQALLAVNGGFFSQDYAPLGLRIREGHTVNALHQTSWWGIFYINNGKPKITTPVNYHINKRIEFAVQAGPRLIVNDRVVKLKPGSAERTAIGITHDDRIILLVTENNPITTTQLATVMQRSEEENGLGCVNALNLDGGSSTQLYAKVDKFSLQIPGFSAISDAVVVLPKQSR